MTTHNLMCTYDEASVGCVVIVNAVGQKDLVAWRLCAVRDLQRRPDIQRVTIGRYAGVRRSVDVIHTRQVAEGCICQCQSAQNFRLVGATLRERQLTYTSPLRKSGPRTCFLASAEGRNHLP